MPLLIPPGYSHVGLQFRHSADPDPWFVTFGVDSSSVTSDPEEIGEACCIAWMDSLDSWQSTEVVLEGAQIVVGQDGADPIRQFVASDIGAGASTAQKLPQNCALLVRKNTTLGGRRNRGRFFVPGMLTEGGVNNVGVITTSDRGAYQGGFDAFLAYLNTQTPILPMFILHNSQGISEPPDPTAVNSLTVDVTIATQRRRLR